MMPPQRVSLLMCLPSGRNIEEVKKWHFVFSQLHCPQRSRAASDAEWCLAVWFMLYDTESFCGSLPNLSLSLQVPVWCFMLQVFLVVLLLLLPLLPYAHFCFGSPAWTHSTKSHLVVERTDTISRSSSSFTPAHLPLLPPQVSVSESCSRVCRVTAPCF